MTADDAVQATDEWFGHIRCATATHPGARRAHNEDACLSRPELGLWAVADGAGGHANGAAASRAVVAALETIPAALTAAEILVQVRQRLASVHTALLAAGLEDAGVMASTVVVMIARGAHFACLWAGDSRLYRLRDGLLEQLTHDHSLVQELLDDGSITDAEADGHPRGNVITRAIGAGAEILELDKVTGEILAGDRFLLCTDGLGKTLPATELLRLLTDSVVAGPLVTAALERFPSDNVTAVTVEVGDNGDAEAPTVPPDTGSPA